METRTRARLSILSELLAFPTVNQKDWEPFGVDVHKDDLVSLCSAPDSKWYVSWVRDIEPAGEFNCARYLLESIDDGELCWWSNVGINVYDRKRTDDRSSWKWNDKQFALYDRWMKVCKRNDAYIITPGEFLFDGDEVTLDVRVRFNISEFTNPCIFKNWKKLTISMMDEYYKECVKLYKDEK